MPKIRKLVQFEKIREVIDIDAIEKTSMVERYVISLAMEEHILEILQDLQQPQHKSAQIIGGYGSGKSHLLAFLISIITEPTLRDKIQNEKVRATAQALTRDFVVVQWELQPNDVSLSDYFYDQVELQLQEKYGISLKIHTTGVVDHKKNILDIITQIKLEHPTRGFVVVVDEISDFLKQKMKEKITQDVQFLRVLGQIAQNSDFVFIGAMQEHVFTNPKYIDEADSIGRVSERFHVVTINREDIKQVISARVLSKTPEQKLELEALFAEYTKHFPHLQASIDEYINLFPLHPYVIQIFSELPYFEKRGVIQFTMQEVEKLLDQEFPCLVAYDRIFDEITSRHTIKNLETVSPIVSAVQTLDSKVELLEPRFQSLARQIIKALAVLRLYGKTTNNGATVRELANTLLAMPANKVMEPTDEIEMVLKKFRKVTDGQFLNVNGEGYYFLDMTITVDYDQVILRKTESLPDGSLDEEILSLLTEQLGLPKADLKGAYPDTCKWNTRRSYREGEFIYETEKNSLLQIEKDYQFVFVSPFVGQSRYGNDVYRAILTGNVSSETLEVLKKTVAARLLMEDNYQRSIMEGKYKKLRLEFIPLLVQAYLETGQVQKGQEKKSVKALITREFRNFAELIEAIKPELFEETFTQRYTKHPKFSQNITRDNSKGEFGSAIKELVNKGTAQNLFTNAKALLQAVGFLDDKGNFSTLASEAAQDVLSQAKAAEGKNVSVDHLFVHFAAVPYGYDRWMVAFILLLLTYNGELALKAKGGTSITSSEVMDVFGKGLDAMENILYFYQESDFNPQPVIDLLLALGLAPGVAMNLRLTAKRGEVIKDFMTRVSEIRSELENTHSGLHHLNLYFPSVVDVAGLQAVQERLSVIPLAEFEKVKTPNSFRNLAYSSERVVEIHQAMTELAQLVRFYQLFNQQLEGELEYAQKIRGLLESYPILFSADEVQGYLNEAYAILGDVQRLMNPQELQPLQGKLQQARQKFVAVFYHAHEQTVGGKVAWSRLSELTQSELFGRLRLLKNITILNTPRQNKLEVEIASTAGLHCTGINVDYLNKKPHCPACQFPMHEIGKNINSRIESFEKEAESIHQEWTGTLIAELQNYRDNLVYLNQAEKELLEPILQSSRLPERITEELVVALNNLFRELEVINIGLDELQKSLFAGAEVLDYVTFEKRLQSWKQRLVAGKDLGKIRFKPQVPED